MAEKVAQHLRARKGIEVVLRHLGLESLGK
jgi:hypothetical protein